MEAHALEDLAIRVVGEVHLLEAHIGRGGIQRDGVLGIDDLLAGVEQTEDAVHVHQGIAQGAVDHAEEVQRHEQLQHQRVDQHQVAQGHHASNHPACCLEHQQGDTDGDDRPLPEIEQGHRVLAAHGGLFPALQGPVVALQLVALVVEVLDRLVVDEPVDGLGIGLGIKPVHLVTEMHAPVGDAQREGDVGEHRGKSDDRERHRIAMQQDGGHQQELGCRRHDVEHQVVENGADALRTAFQITRDGSGVALQMETQRQPVEVLQHLVGEAAHGVIAHAREQRIAQFVEQRRRQA